METYSPEHKTKIPRYNGGPNFERWQTSIQVTLMSMEVWEVASGDEEKPKMKTEKGEQSVTDLAEAVKAWTLKNNKALALVYNSLGDDVKPILRDMSVAKLWKELNDQYGRRTRADVGHLIRKLVDRRKKPEEAMQKFLGTMTDAYNEIIGIRPDAVSEDLLIVLLATGVPPEYSSTSISIMNDTTMTLSQIKGVLMSAESTIKQNRLVGGGTGGTGQPVPAASAAAAASAPSRAEPAGSTSRSDPPRNTCTFCKKPYHTQENCWERPENAGKRPAGWKSGLHGTQARARAATVEGDSSEAIAAAVARSVNSGRVLVARSAEYALHGASSTDSRAIDLIVDSGASQHMFADVRCFETLSATSQTVSTCESGRTVVPIGQGTAVLEIAGNTWRFKDALCIPSLNGNLVSLSRVQSRGGGWQSGGEHALDVISPGGDVMSATLQTDGLYHVNALLTQLTSEVVDAHQALVASSTHSASQLKWFNYHQAFGHINDDALEATLAHFDIPYKRNIPLAIRLWTETMEPQTGARLKILRSDNGGEFLGSDFQTWLRQHGVKHKLTVPNTPQQNGVAERLNRTLLQMVRTWLVQGNLDPQLWGELVITAAYLRNHVWNSTVRNVPLTLWEGRPPTVPALVPIGLCWVDQNLPGQDKLAPRAVPGVVLGYHDSKTYRVLLEGQTTITLATTVRQRQRPSMIDQPSHPPLTADDDDAASDDSATSVDALVDAPAPRPEEPSPAIPTSPIPSVSLDPSAPLLEPPVATVPDDVLSPAMSMLDIPGEAPTTANDGLTSPQIVPVDSDSEQSDTDDTPRQSSRSRRAPERYGLRAVIQEERHSHEEALPSDVITDGVATEMPTDPVEPKTYEEAVHGPHQQEWKRAIETELSCLAKNNTWTAVPLPANAHTITAKWVFKLKRDAVGTIIKHKARLVARGFSQVEGIDYTETFAPVSRLSSFRVFLAQAVARRMFIHHLDVETAFLYGDCDADIYLVPPKGCQVSRGLVFKLKKSLYGLKQAPRIWHAKLTSTMASLGFKESLAEPCLFERDNDVDEYAALIMYVDDLGLAFSSMNSLKTILDQLRRAFVVNDLGPISWYLGIRVEYDRHNGVATLDQATYIQSMLDRFGIDRNDASVESPMAVQHDNVMVATRDYDSPHFPSMIGSILYAAQGTRFDVSFAVSYLSRSLQRVTKAAHRGAIRLLKYLARHRDLKLVYRCTDAATDLVIKGYADADFATDPSRHSVSGFIFFLAGGPVTWASKRQTKIAVNTQEAELTATFAAAKEALWLAKFYSTGMARRAPYGTRLLRQPICLLGDSQNALAYLKKQGAHERTKHYNVELKWLQQIAGRLLLTFSYVPSMVNIADILTKSVAVDTHIRLRALATATVQS
ncbi:unnamed protein product [Parajaminaea phylloscopi]